MKFVWPESARSELRAIDREAALRVLHALTEYGESGKGDIKALAGPALAFVATPNAGAVRPGSALGRDRPEALNRPPIRGSSRPPRGDENGGLFIA